MRVNIKHTVSADSTPDAVVDLILADRVSSQTVDLRPSTVDFINPPHPTTLSLKDFGFEQSYIDEALEQILSLHPSLGREGTASDAGGGVKNTIVIYSDYDADGITGGAVLWETMHSLGFDVHPYIGDRVEEGYGLSSIGIDKVKKQYNPALIITVDHGISGKDQVTYAKSIGINVIVTDHHHRSEERVPTDARAIFHIPTLSGSGVAYYVAKEITNKCSHTNIQIPNNSQLSNITSQFGSDYLALASIGTIADLVPLTGPSRSVAKYGLQALTSTTRVGLLALYKVAGHLGKTISPYEVGFQIAPRINASGRLDSALDALRLLCTNNVPRAQALAEKLNTLNQERQDMTKHAVEEAVRIVEGMKNAKGELPKILIVHQGVGIRPPTCRLELGASRSMMWWHEGIIGLIASKLCEKYYRPVIVLTPSEQIRSSKSEVTNTSQLPVTSTARSSRLEAIFKASARSIPGFHLSDFLARHHHLLLKYGGHAAAAGLSVTGELLEAFSNIARADAETLITDDMLEKTLKVDIDMPLDWATEQLVEKLEVLEPYGMSNPRPVFQSTGIIQEIRTMGKENQHLKLVVTDESPKSKVEGRRSSLSLLSFGKAAEYAHLKTGMQVQVVYTLDINEWQGKRTPQGKVLYLRGLS
ncbi:MAG: DHH family phosphoesterase [Candidatus Roizmanbacteria bacterium]